jgi:hypothetical protein
MRQRPYRTYPEVVSHLHPAPKCAPIFELVIEKGIRIRVASVVPDMNILFMVMCEIKPLCTFSLSPIWDLWFNDICEFYFHFGLAYFLLKDGCIFIVKFENLL